jgi:hypothetical protein
MRNKKMIGPDRVVRVSWAVNICHPVWDGAPESFPSREDCPEAFTRVVMSLSPAKRAAKSRQKPHKTLSRTQLRKRLSRAGLSNERLRARVDRVMAGPRAEDLPNLASAPDLSHMALGWPTGLLVPAIGRDAARRALRFVARTPWCYLRLPVGTQAGTQG